MQQPTLSDCPLDKIYHVSVPKEGKACSLEESKCRYCQQSRK